MCGLEGVPRLPLPPQVARHVAPVWVWCTLGIARLLPLHHGGHALETRSEGRAAPPRVTGGLDHATVSRHDDRSVKSFLHLATFALATL